MRRVLGSLVVVMSMFVSWADAQLLTDEVRLLGYSQEGHTTYFVFDTSIYGVEPPNRVVVTGAFRGWSQDMNNPEWQLTSDEEGIWTLSVPNFSYEVISPATPFKYRINDGEWLDPPAGAENAEGGNLIFMHNVKPTSLKAELRGERAVWMTLSGDDIVRSLDPADYHLVSAQGEAIPIQAVIPNTATETLIVPDQALDIRRVYYLEVPDLEMRTLLRRDPWFRTLYSDKELGANISEDRSKTTFRIFSPRADLVRLYLYRGAYDTPEEAFKTIEMTRDAVGVWEAEEAGDLHGVYYDFTVHGPPDPGNYFYETHPVHISDPYARVSVDSFGKSRVWRKTVPATPLVNGRPKMEDVIAYEVHVQDFTDLLPVSDDLKGTIPAMVTPGLRNSQGQPIGLDHLVDLGINVVHLMPVQEFLHYPDDEWQAAFKDDPYMIAQGINMENYQWGYRTTHAFAIESRFRQRGTDYGAERDQFRDLVQAFHDRGIAVIIDLVPNHTGENMDGRHYLFNFNVLDLAYYHRTNNDVEHIGPFGNEIKTEDRPMVQRWVVDQCKALIEEFGIDGYRIDLAGQIDQQTLIRVREELGEDVIIYGEPWIPPSDPDVVANPDWAWYKVDAPITFFQDDARNAFKGPVSNPQDKTTDRGFAGGNASEREAAMRALLNDYPEEPTPNAGINYLDIHDNWALADQFATTDWDGRFGVDEGPFKIAAGLLFTSVGPLVLHGGSEFMRSKGSAPLVEMYKETASGRLAYHGKSDTYNTRVANQFVWENLGKTRADAGSYNDYANMNAYWRGLIALRMSAYGQVFRIGERPEEDYYDWILPENDYQLGYIVDETVLVLINTEDADNTFEEVELPAGSWRLVASDDAVDHMNGVSGTDAALQGGRSHRLSVPATSLKIWVRD